MKPLYIKEITLVNFKNYRDARFQLGERFNLVHGLNGTGKTNLLDSIYYLCVGKSFFTPFDHKTVHYGQSFFRLEGNIHRAGEDHQILVKAKPGISKELLVDGLPKERISDHLGFAPVVISAPKDIDLIMGSGQSRRRYIDHLLCQIDSDYLTSLVSYNHLLNLRNAALKQGFKDLRRMIQTYDEQMGPHAKLIFEKRKWLESEMTGRIKDFYKILSDDVEQTGFSYESKLKEYAYEVLADRNWENDRASQRSQAGIHKDDFMLSIKGMPAKDYASQGQIKSIIFSLHLSKYHTLGSHRGLNPILILDDVFDKLDEKRLTRLMELLISDDYGQICISDTSDKRVKEFVPGRLLKEIRMSS